MDALSLTTRNRFIFRLYDIDGDNVITLDELSRIFYAVYRLLGDNVNLKHDQLHYEAQAEKFYREICQTSSGDSIDRAEFHRYCMSNPSIVETINMFEFSICSGA